MKLCAYAFGIFSVSTGLAAAQVFDFDENGFIAEAAMVQTVRCVRPDGVTLESWRSTADDFEEAIFNRLSVNGVALAEETMWLDGHQIDIRNVAVIEIVWVGFTSRYNPMVIRDDLLTDRGLEPWDFDDPHVSCS